MISATINYLHYSLWINGSSSRESILIPATVLFQVQGYETKVPEDVRAANKEKLSQTRTEVERLTEAIKALQAL